MNHCYPAYVFCNEQALCKYHVSVALLLHILHYHETDLPSPATNELCYFVGYCCRYRKVSDLLFPFTTTQKEKHQKKSHIVLVLKLFSCLGQIISKSKNKIANENSILHILLLFFVAPMT